MTSIRGRVLAEAKTWLGTPYQHQASEKCAGCDCLGLIRGLYRYVYGTEPTVLPPYTPNWAEEQGEETLYQAAQLWLNEIPNSTAQPGDIVLFRMSPNAPCKHVAVLSAPDQITHAYWGRAVVESYFVPYWQRRWVSSFAFPDTSKHSLLRGSP